MPRMIGKKMSGAVAIAMMLASTALADVKVQDITRLQGQRFNKLMGFGLVVGLDGTGDGDKYQSTMRALSELHKHYASPIQKLDELKNNNSVAIVSVEVTLPEFGAREGQRLDVVVSSLGPAKSLKGGQLLVTPLQISPLAMAESAEPLATAGGPITLTDPTNLKRGVIRGGANVDADLMYSFIDGDVLTLVLDETQASWSMAQMIARAINHEFTSMAGDAGADSPVTRVVVRSDMAVAVAPNLVQVRVPQAELPRPAPFISRVQETSLYALPELPARIIINSVSKAIIARGKVTISPTTLNLAGMSVTVGAPAAGDAKDGAKTEAVDFDALLAMMKKLQVPQAQIVQAVEQLARSGLLHAKLEYQE